MMRRSRQPRGFTLIELTVVVLLSTVVMGLVIIRSNLGSSRQQVLQSARSLGNLIQTYREKAQSQECLYALVLELDTGSYFIAKPTERSTGWEKTAPLLKSGKLSSGLHFGKARCELEDLKSPVVVYFDRRGVASPLSLEVLHTSGARVALTINPLINEVNYDEP